jgi:cell division septum initiation protein DivIVA
MGATVNLLGPDEIGMHHFSRRLFGADPKEVREFLSRIMSDMGREIAHAESRAADLETSLQELTPRTQHLEQELATVRDKLAITQSSLADAEQKLAAHQGKENQIAQVLINAQRLTDEIAARAKVEADERTAAAGQTAEQIVANVRRMAAQILRDARHRAREMTSAADTSAATRLLEARSEADRTVSDAREAVARLHQTAHEHVGTLTTEIDEIISLRSGLEGDLEEVVKRHTGSLEKLTRIVTEVQRDVLPFLTRVRHNLQEAGSGIHAPLSIPTAIAPPRQSRERGSHQTKTALSRGSVQDQGEILISPIASLLEATKFSIALSRLPIISMARLRTFSGGVATIDVTTEGEKLTEIDVNGILGYRVSVSEYIGPRLVLDLRESPL